MVHGLWQKLELFKIFIYFSAILYASPSILDIAELSVQYGIEITSKPVILKPQSVDENIIQLSSKHGQVYSCFLPHLPQDDEKEPNENSTPVNVTDILDKSMNGTCITHKKGWWTYKLCHKTSVTQYHAGEAGDAEGVITTLGLYSSEDDWNDEEVLTRKPSEIFHSHQYVNGSICDVTLKPRKVNIQYFCASKAEDNIIRVEEPSTCEYIITVHNTQLCNHPLFSKKEKKKQIGLVCSPALLEHEYNKYTEKLNKKKRKEETRKMEMLKKMKEEKEKLKAKKVRNSDVTVKKDVKLKDEMNEISSFMEGFMKAININLDDVKASPNIKIPNEAGEKPMEMKDDDEFPNDSDLENKLDDIEHAYKKSMEKLESKLDITDNLDDLGDSMQKSLDDIKSSVSGLDNVLMPESNENINPVDPNNEDMEDNQDIESNQGIPTNEKESGTVDPDMDSNLPIKGKASVLKNLNDVTETMIQQLEVDSESMKTKSYKEREKMDKEFNRVRAGAIKELERTQDMLKLLEKLEKESNNGKSKKQLQQQIQSVRTLVEGLEGQIKTIDDKRTLVDQMEKDTTKRLEDINKKIVNTRKAHKFAKSFEHLANEQDTDGEFNKIISNAFQKIKKKQSMEAAVKKESSNSKDGDGNEDDENQDNDDDETIETDSLKDKMIKNQRGKNAKLMKTMLKTLKDQLIKLNTKIKHGGKGKSNSHKKAFDATNGKVHDVGDVNKGTDDNDKVVQEKTKLHSKSTLNDVVDLLKKQIKNLSEKGKLKKVMEKKNEKHVTSEDSDPVVQDDVSNEDDVLQDKKDNLEVRIRTIDGKFLDKDFENENVDENVREEVKQVTKEMEDTVRKQLKEAGFDFSDRIKIKIITTKDKFEKFSSGKDVKLLSDDDAANFKDLLLGFLGGGKEKVGEEQRQKVLEENYNFVLNSDEEE